MPSSSFAVLAALALFAALLPAVSAQGTANRLRVEYGDRPLGVDVATPRFSYALVHPQRAQVQTSYRIVVSVAGGGAVAWDSGTVASNTSLNIGYKGTPLASDTDYVWSVVWADSAGALSAPATSSFSTGLYLASDWRGAEWVSSPAGKLNTFRTQITVASAVTRARMYITGLGYAKTWLNGHLTDDHELGSFTTFQQRTLYDVVDVTSQLNIGCNALGIMLGAGWWAQSSINAGLRQFRLLLAVTTVEGATTYYTSANAAGAPGALVFQATAGPVTADDIYDGESYDGRIAAALAGWTMCGFVPSSAWTATEAPAITPTTYGAVISSHPVPIRTDRDYSALTITQPTPGTFVVDFGQNMAGQTTLRVEDCPNGTIITLIHNEILNPDGTVNRNLAKMEGQYTCAGLNGVETYRTLFSYYGFRYVQINGWPGVPGEESVSAHFIHSSVPQSGEFSSSNTLLNAIQHATRFASWSNLMDVPTDCPQRERRGWLGDAQLSFETVIHNIDGGEFYTKWLADFADTQVYDNRTMNAKGALPDCIPFYDHGHTESDPGWGIAAWTITDWFSDYLADDVFDVAWYPNMRWYMEHWIDIATANNGLFNVFWWGDWGNYVPGPYGFQTAEYPQYFYVTALDISAKFATRLGFQADAARYTSVATAARALYQSLYYNETTGCYAGCTYVSQIFALTLGLAGPQGSPAEVLAWSHVMDWFSANATKGMPEHFGGGIISLKLSLPLFDAHGETGLALKMHLQTDKAPGFGYWIETGGATTLWEQWNMDSISGTASRSHIMFGAAGAWYFKSLAGLGRAPSSRSWANLVIAPPGPASGVYASNVSWASASIDSSMGIVSTAWDLLPAGAGTGCGKVAENAALHFTCPGGTFSGVTFASFGTPTGSCGGGFKKGACDAATSVATVAAACVGKGECTIEATNEAFGGDPCVNTPKLLAVQLAGACGASPGVRKLGLATIIPVGGVASVVLPTMGALATATVFEGNKTVWTAGAFVAGDAGVAGAQAAADGASVVFAVGSGSYAFQVYQP